MDEARGCTLDSHPQTCMQEDERDVLLQMVDEHRREEEGSEEERGGGA